MKHDIHNHQHWLGILIFKDLKNTSISSLSLTPDEASFADDPNLNDNFLLKDFRWALIEQNNDIHGDTFEASFKTNVATDVFSAFDANITKGTGPMALTK